MKISVADCPFFNTQGPSASAYVTYYKSEDALRAIQAVNNVVADGRTLKASLGTTKYCSHFMKNMPCPKHDCMYLHELGKSSNHRQSSAVQFKTLAYLQGTRPPALQRKRCSKGNIQNMRKIYTMNYR